jgi:uncharacterized protein (DUF488 family)
MVIDVRSVPYSRFHPQFRQSNLKASLEQSGIKYLFLGNELGGRPTNSNLYSNGTVNYEAIKKTAIFKEGINKVLSIAEQKIKVTLTCSERDQNECHRKNLIADVLHERQVTVLHINKVGNVEKHSETANPSLFS